MLGHSAQGPSLIGDNRGEISEVTQSTLDSVGSVEPHYTPHTEILIPVAPPARVASLDEARPWLGAGPARAPQFDHFRLKLQEIAFRHPHVWCGFDPLNKVWWVRR